MTSGRVLARNSALNLLGQGLPVLAAVVAIPPLVRGLGAERFGVLTLAWAAIGYFSLFELGLSRALTQAVAQRLGSGSDGEIPTIASTALVLLFVFGVVGGIVLAVIAPTLATRILNIPEHLQRETVLAFWILASVLPVVLATVGLRGLMEAHQHFGIATVLRVPLVAFTFVGPLLLLPFSKSLVPAVTILAIGRVVALATHAWVCLRLYSYLRQPIVFQKGPTVALLRFGGWSTVSNIVSPMMVYLDRFVIGAILTVAAVAHYVTPYEVVVKLLIIPVAVASVMLPALASSMTTNPPLMAQLYEKALRAVMLTTFPFVLIAVTLAQEGLLLWIGAVLPIASADVVRWLAIGVFTTALAQAPLIALQGAGRPDLIAKLHVAELPLYVGGLLILTRFFGVRGVAMAWTIRATLDAVALFWIARRTLRLPVVPQIGGAWPPLIMLAVLVLGGMLASTQARVAFVAAMLMAFVPLAWLTLLTSSERDGLLSWMKSLGRTETESIEELV